MLRTAESGIVLDKTLSLMKFMIKRIKDNTTSIIAFTMVNKFVSNW
jgi:hypothetical protein